MSKADKAGEPSMDEILASIRKIIAEEPVGARKGASSEGAGADASSSRPPVATKPSQDDARLKPDASPRAEAAADANTRLRDDGPSWLRPSANAQPMGQGDKAAGQRDPVKPFFSEMARGPGTAVDPLSPPAGGPQSVDFGAIVPRRAADGSIEVPGGATGERRPQSGRLPEWLARSAPSTPQSGRMTGPLPPPAEPTRAPPRDVAASGAALSELATLRSNGAMPIPPPPGLAMDNAPRVAQPVSAQPMTVETPRTAPLAAATEAAVKDEAVAAAAPDARPEPHEVAAQMAKSPAPSALDAPVSRTNGAAPAPSPEPAGRLGAAHVNGVGLAEPVNGVAQAPKAAGARTPLNGASEPHDAVAVSTHSTVPMEPAGPRSERPVPVAEPSSTLPKPAALAERPKAPKPATAADLVPAAPAAAGVRTLEDTVVDLLRPMIRQWLDENMPRMVEKALRIELAQSVKPKIEPPKH